MPSTTTFEFGDIVLVPFPFTDQSSSKQRPAVVVSSPAYHLKQLDVILLAITSQMRASAFGAESAITQWRDAGLLKPSVLKPVIATVESRMIRKQLGRLRDRDLRELRRVLSVILGE